MGQYFRPILGDKDGFNCMVFDRSIDGEYMFAKLTEHSWWLNPFVNSFAYRLFNEQKRVCWVGDYTQDEDFNFAVNTSLHTPNYKEVWADKVELHSSTSVDFTLDNKFLINFDTMQFLDLNEYKLLSADNYGWVLHPLPLLTAVGNDRGFGDFHQGNIGFEFVGTWAWNLISICNYIPADFDKINIIFKEERVDSYAEVG